MTKRRKIVRTAAAIVMSLAIAITPTVGTKAATVNEVTADGVEGNETTLKPGESIQLYADVSPDEEGEDISVSWAVDGNYSSSTTVTEDGLLTVGLDEKADWFYVVVVSNSTPESEQDFVIDVDTGEKPDPTPTYADITSVTVSGPDTMAPGEEEKFTVDIQGNGIFEKNKTWSVEGNTSADTTIDEYGVLHVASDETANTLTVIATPLANPNVPGSKTVTITHNDEPEKPTITEVKWISGTGYIVKGTSDYFTAEVRGTGNYDTSIVWTLTGNTSEGTSVNENGVVTVAADETASQLTLRAASKADPDKYVETTFEVREPEVETKVTDVQIGGAKEIKKGSSDRILGRAVGIGDVDPSVTWTVSGNTSKDTTVDAEGNVTVGKDETAKAITVTATSVQDPTVSAAWNVTIKEADKPTNPDKPSNPDKPVTPEKPVTPVKPSTTQDNTKTAGEVINKNVNKATNSAVETIKKAAEESKKDVKDAKEETKNASDKGAVQTGDNTMAIPAVMMTAAAAAVGIAIVSKKKKEASAED